MSKKNEATSVLRNIKALRYSNWNKGYFFIHLKQKISSRKLPTPVTTAGENPVFS